MAQRVGSTRMASEPISSQMPSSAASPAKAGIAGCLVQATVQQDMTNHTGTVTFLYYEAKTGKTYQLNSMGTIVPGLPPLRPIPPGTGMYAAGPLSPFAVIPGFMPGMKALHERFGTKPWSTLCQPAIHWAEEGEVVVRGLLLAGPSRRGTSRPQTRR